MNRAAVSIRDVAVTAGVSVGTVSNVLNRPDVVSANTRKKVLAAIAELGFVRNESARQLRLGHSRTLGLVVLDVANPFFTDVARGVEDAANESGLAVILCNSDEKASKEAAYIDLLEEQRVQGILITPVDVINERLDLVRGRGTPVVLLDRRATSAEQCSVAVDDVLGGELAATHLLDMGHQRIAYVGGPFSIRQVQDRHDGALKAMQRQGRSATELTVIETPGLNVASGRAAGAQLVEMRGGRRPTAAFCANDLIALGLLQELMLRQRLRVPEDMAIVGYDDIVYASSAAVPLSSVQQPRQLLGRTAAELLLEEATDAQRHEHRQVVFEPELKIRESSMVRRRRRTARTNRMTGVPSARVAKAPEDDMVGP